LKEVEAMHMAIQNPPVSARRKPFYQPSLHKFNSSKAISGRTIRIRETRKIKWAVGIKLVVFAKLCSESSFQHGT
jgi:hypothetical protein